MANSPRTRVTWGTVGAQHHLPTYLPNPGMQLPHQQIDTPIDNLFCWINIIIAFLEGQAGLA